MPIPSDSSEQAGSAIRPGAPDRQQGGAYAWYVVGVLIVAYTFSFIDRQVLTLMVGPIRETLSISDTQLSLLHGFAFALFYTVMGIPIGRMIDQHKRTTIIAAGIVVWSLMTAACGLARNFGQMFVARIGVGVGEAALSPGAYSLIGDYFPPEKRAQALSLYLGAAHIGAGLAIMIGGTLVALMPPLTIPHIGRIEPWQGVFIVVGLPGLLVALWTMTLREPPRSGVKKGVDPRFREVLAYMGRHGRAYLLFILGFALSGLMWNGALAWLPTYFMRNFGWSTSDVGFRYGLVIMTSGLLGAVTGGHLTVRLRQRGYIDASLLVGLASLLLAAPAGLVGTLAEDGLIALVGVFVFLFACALPYGGAVAALQDITPNQFRGQVSAIYLFSISLLGMGFGPTVVALFTDLVFANDAAIGHSLAVMIAVGSSLAFVVLWLARAPYKEAFRKVDF